MRVEVNALSKKYPVEIGELPPLNFNSEVAIVTNPKVAGLHLQYLLKRLSAPEIYIITLPDGEQYKTMENVQFGLERLFDHRLTRNSYLIAFGGGVIGDMTGFMASIFLRGVKFLQIPTTLLAMVDSSVGGKTGVNNRFGKNLIGTFYQPEAVYIDPYFLETLPAREFNAGMAEVIKISVMFDRHLFYTLKGLTLHIAPVIKKSVEIKANVVSADERERGIRSVLNYGHTFGHAIERLTNYSRYLHGEAVAIGMVMANRLAVKLGLLSAEEEQEIEELIKKYQLPTRFKVESRERFYQLFFTDKKRKGDKIKFILPNGIGNYKIVENPPKKLLFELFEELSG